MGIGQRRTLLAAYHARSRVRIDMQKPRTVNVTETIEKAVPVEREVTTQKAYTKHVDVEVEKPVETSKQVEVEKPVTRYEEREITKPVTVGKDVTTQARRRGLSLPTCARTHAVVAQMACVLTTWRAAMRHARKKYISLIDA
jgi:hypothetical protein